MALQHHSWESCVERPKTIEYVRCVYANITSIIKVEGNADRGEKSNAIRNKTNGNRKKIVEKKSTFLVSIKSSPLAQYSLIFLKAHDLQIDSNVWDDDACLYC